MLMLLLSGGEMRTLPNPRVPCPYRYPCVALKLVSVDQEAIQRTICSLLHGWREVRAAGFRFHFKRVHAV